MTHTSIIRLTAKTWRWKLALLTLATSSAIPLNSVEAQERSSTRYSATVRAIERAEPAVVNIEGNKVSKTGIGSKTSEANVNGMGAGVIIDPRGYILTNQHVVQDVKRIDVTMLDGQQYTGTLIARDTETDLAVIKIDANRELPVIPCGTSSDLMRGERVVAIGNPFGYHDSVSEGIISALHRNIPVNGVQDYPDLIQTDASINPGNSGGPLLNADGQMIGINAAVRIGAQGIGFAIPIDRAIEVAASMIAQNENRASVAAEVKTEYRNGRSWVRVVSSSTAELRPNDIVHRLGDREVKNRLDYELALIGYSSSTANLTIERDGERKSAAVALARSATQNSGKFRLTAATNWEDRIYRELGLKLEVAEPDAVRKIDPSYSGGMRIQSVRPGSPAQKAELQRGDTLVGLVGWQTTNWSDLEYILKSKDWQAASNPEIHIIRNKKVYSNKLDLQATRPR
jgi:serine protease Do